MFFLHISMCIHTPLVQLGCVKGALKTLYKSVEKLLSSSSAAAGETQVENGLVRLWSQRTLISPAQA